MVRLSDRFVALVAGGYDLAIRAGERGDSTLAARTLGRMRVRCHAAPSWLAAHPAPRTPADLAEHDVVLFAPELRAEWTFDLPEGLTVPVRGRLAVNSHRLHAEAAEAGLGVARLFPHLAADAVARGALVPGRPGWESPAAKLHVVTPGPTRTAAVRAVLAVLDEVVGGSPRG